MLHQELESTEGRQEVSAGENRPQKKKTVKVGVLGGIVHRRWVDFAAGLVSFILRNGG